MRFILAALALIAMVGVAVYERQQVNHEKLETENRWIYGFGIRRGVPPFADYLEQVTAEGLREIRWDHMPPRFTTVASSSTWTTVTSASNTLVTMCGIPSTITVARVFQ